MAAKPKKPDTKKLCAGLKEIHDANVEIANDTSQSEDDRAEAADIATRARGDAYSWGCGWAARM